ncbi:hypothetical protein [Ilumatobacter nonamiensis]|uniref:hypothetical protein n=1 Tax=Ilumatobacter nonamiensis TaxID=467093 RepID=UPI0011D25528|nr:hypothetical protein [Ilumatobacter nonamiensis]
MQFPPTNPTPDEGESGVLVSMADDLVVIRPAQRVELDTTHVLVDAAASAVTAGALVMVDLDHETDSDDLLWFRPRHDDTTPSLASEPGVAEVLAPGWVRLSTRDAYWTIDVARSRLFRSETLVDPHFVADPAWTGVRALWISCTHVTALTADGSYLSTRTAWTSSRARRRPIPA